jgi:hypothetical protein
MSGGYLFDVSSRSVVVVCRRCGRHELCLDKPEAHSWARRHEDDCNPDASQLRTVELTASRVRRHRDTP